MVNMISQFDFNVVGFCTSLLKILKPMQLASVLILMSLFIGLHTINVPRSSKI